MFVFECLKSSTFIEYGLKCRFFLLPATPLSTLYLLRDGPVPERGCHQVSLTSSVSSFMPSHRRWSLFNMDRIIHHYRRTPFRRRFPSLTPEDSTSVTLPTNVPTVPLGQVDLRTGTPDSERLPGPLRKLDQNQEVSRSFRMEVGSLPRPSLPYVELLKKDPSRTPGQNDLSDSRTHYQGSLVSSKRPLPSVVRSPFYEVRKRLRFVIPVERPFGFSVGQPGQTRRLSVTE